MPEVTFILRDGSTRVVDIAEGMSVMQAAVLNDVEGIEGECGGCCACATCHVYVESLAAGELPAMKNDEDGLLDGVDERRANSRLGCQIVMGPSLRGLVVRMTAR